MSTTETHHPVPSAAPSSPDSTPEHWVGRRRWHIPWLQLVACLVILAGVCVFLYPHAASWFAQKEQSRVTELAKTQLDSPPNNDEAYRQQQLEMAHEYNGALSSGALYEANANVAVGAGESSDNSFDYEALLRTTDTGVMGRLQYEALQIDLPIYHGTSDETLLKGVGHLEGTSLPVGGVDTRSVLTAHRGLPQATLFNDLDKAKNGDTFTISVLGQVLTYRVVETKVIDPGDTEAILTDRERDLVTLVTCTPLGINTHRILVTGERITPTPKHDLLAAQAEPELPGFPWWVVGLGATVVVLAGYIWVAGRPSREREHERERANSKS